MWWWYHHVHHLETVCLFCYKYSMCLMCEYFHGLIYQVLSFKAKFYSWLDLKFQLRRINFNFKVYFKIDLTIIKKK